jgi:hypothetical protein
VQDFQPFPLVGRPRLDLFVHEPFVLVWHRLTWPQESPEAEEVGRVFNGAAVGALQRQLSAAPVRLGRLVWDRLVCVAVQDVLNLDEPARERAGVCLFGLVVVVVERLPVVGGSDV